MPSNHIGEMSHEPMNWAQLTITLIGKKCNQVSSFFHFMIQENSSLHFRTPLVIVVINTFYISINTYMHQIVFFFY
jgi:hypothetical protein